MESKRKTRKVRKARKATPEPKESPKRQDKTYKPTTEEALVRYNAELVESLFSSQGWKEIAFPLLYEMKASVSGRFTNGRFHKGDLTRSESNLDKLSGYQMALEEFYNRLHDFIVIRDKKIAEKKEEETLKKAEIYNPFMEELNEYQENYQ